MKFLVGFVVVLACASLSFGQTTINVYQNQPVPMQFAHQTQLTRGSGCVGAQVTGGTGCVGTRAQVQSNGCTGYSMRAAPQSSVGYAIVGYEKVPVMVERPVYGLEVRGVTAPAYRGGYVSPAPARYGTGHAAGAAAYADGVPYGAKVGPGAYATPSGRQAAPAIFSEPGAAFPCDGPIRRGTRAAFGYDR